MKKWLLAAGFIGAFGIGAMSGGTFLSFASSDTGIDTDSSTSIEENQMMNESQESGAMSMMSDQTEMSMAENMDQMNTMENMDEMMGTMAVMDDFMNDLVNETAKTLKLTTDQLEKELESGKTLALIAEEQGVKADQLAKEFEKVIQNTIKQWEKEGIELSQQQQEMFLSMGKNSEMMLNTPGMFTCNMAMDDPESL